MTTLCGRYVSTFAEASHALPEGMHMNADYPFMLPRIARLEGVEVEIREGGKSVTFSITKPSKRTKVRREYGYIEQCSTFERCLGDGKPTRFLMLPFKDEKTPAIGSSQSSLFVPSPPAPLQEVL